MITSLMWLLFYAVVALAFWWRYRYEVKRDRKAQEMSEHCVQLRERKANEELWNLLEKDDPQWLKEMGIQMPRMQVFDLEREFDRLWSAKRQRAFRRQGLGRLAYPGMQVEPQQASGGAYDNLYAKTMAEMMGNQR